MRSLRATLTLWYTVALAATVLAFGVAITLIERGSNFRELESRLRASVREVERVLADGYRGGGRLVEHSNDPLTYTLRADLYRLLDPVAGWVIVVDSAGHGVYGSAEVRRLTPQAADSLRGRVFVTRPDLPFETYTLRLDGTPVRFVAVDVSSAGPDIAAVAVGEPVLDAEDAPRRLITSLLLISPLILLFGAGVGYVLSSRALQPVRAMIDELEAITDGRSLHRRLPVAGGAEPNELGRLANAINAVLARLETSFSAMRRFVADASHELKTPLTVMRAGVERALTDPRSPPEVMVPLEETLQEIQRTAEVVDTLLTLARVDEGRMDLARAPVELAGVLSEVFETAQILGEEAGVSVHLELPEEPVVVDADAARMHQLVMNLVTNAVKYTPRGGSVWISLTATAGSATIAVRDTGIGIAPGDIARVFDRFWRADMARSRTGERPGIGLGLSISKWIAEAHGGSIGVTSRPGRGSTFTVTLPRTPTTLPVTDS
ncbi:MAG TPA: HAMP domain-containing sensor histidine kinase [Gemmatimonadales bacterium]|nr:HAMP domain-containing sensor histidine kinase [Gemmatimonadales bacterium]